MALGSIAILANITVVALLFARVYSSMAMANFGQRRLFEYALVFLWLSLLLVVELMLIQATKLHSGIPPAIVVASSLVLTTLLIADLRELREPPSEAFGQVETLNWIRDSTPCDARILANRRTSGAFQVLAGRAGVNEGMGPFFRPELLRAVNHLLVETNAFYEDPRDGNDFLARHGVDYVVLFPVVRTRDLREAVGVPERMEEASFLDLVFTGRSASIYRVDDAHPVGEVPRGSDYPGYVCQSGPLRS